MNDSLPENTYLAIAAEAEREHMFFVGHVPPSIGATRASDVGQKYRASRRAASRGAYCLFGA